MVTSSGYRPGERASPVIRHDAWYSSPSYSFTGNQQEPDHMWILACVESCPGFFSRGDQEGLMVRITVSSAKHIGIHLPVSTGNRSCSTP
jgi:hypothetical protein